MRTKLSWQILATAALMAVGTANAQTLWTGAQSNDWFDALNWDPNAVPDSGTAVVINEGTSNVAGSAQALSVHITGVDGNHGQLGILGGADLTVGGTTYLGEGGFESRAYISGALNSDGLVVGNTGVGELNLEPGGVVTVGSGGTGVLVLGQNAGSKGYLNVDDGTINASAVQGGSGDEQNVTFFQSAERSHAAAFTGNLSVFQNGGASSVTTLAGANTYTGTTTVVSGTLVIQNSLGNSQVLVTGGTFLAKTGVSIVNPVILAGGTYEKELTAGPLDNAINARSDFGVDGIATTVVLLDGELSENATLQSSFAATSLADNDEVRMSDVFSFSGVPEGDVFVLQLEIADLPENAILGWLNADNEWENAVLGNIGGTIVFVNGAYNPSEHDEVGTYGRNGNTVWAVLNHNSEFSVIPEPSSIALLAGGLVFLLRRRQS